MPEFLHVDHPHFSPTHCRTCTTSHCPAGFIDTGLEDHSGRWYICAGCVRQAAVIVGCLDPGDHARMLDNLADQVAETRRITAELEQALADRTVPLDDLRAVLAEGRRQKQAT